MKKNIVYIHLCSKITADDKCSHEIKQNKQTNKNKNKNKKQKQKQTLTPWKESYDQPR